MIQIFFQADNEYFEKVWPVVPRIGETVILGMPHVAFKVTDVVWDGHPEKPIARLQIKRVTPG